MHVEGFGTTVRWSISKVSFLKPCNMLLLEFVQDPSKNYKIKQSKSPKLGCLSCIIVPRISSLAQCSSFVILVLHHCHMFSGCEAS